MSTLRALPSKPSYEQIGRWVVDTCRLFGTSIATAHKVAGAFIEQLEIDRASPPTKRDGLNRPYRSVDWTTFVRGDGQPRGVGRVSLSCGHDVPTNEAHLRSRQVEAWCSRCPRNERDYAVCDDIGVDCPEHGRQTS